MSKVKDMITGPYDCVRVSTPGREWRIVDTRTSAPPLAVAYTEYHAQLITDALNLHLNYMQPEGPPVVQLMDVMTNIIKANMPKVTCRHCNGTGRVQAIIGDAPCECLLCGGTGKR